jgi:archaellum component FlaC
MKWKVNQKKKININNEEIKRIENRIIPIDAELAIITAELIRQRDTTSGTTGRMARINDELKKRER